MTCVLHVGTPPDRSALSCGNLIGALGLRPAAQQPVAQVPALLLTIDILHANTYRNIPKPYPKAPCSFIVHTWALKGLPYHTFGVYVYTTKLHGAFG